MTSLDLSAKAIEHPLLGALTHGVRSTVLKASEYRRLRAGRTILRQGQSPDAVYCLLEGAARVFYRSESGEELSCKLLRAPAFFGEMEVLAGCEYVEYVTSLEQVDLVIIPAELFRRLARTQLAFAHRLVCDLSARLLVSALNERALAFEEIEARLAALLLDYGRMFGSRVGAEVQLATRLSQERIARDLAVSRKSVVRALSAFRAAGLIRKDAGRYYLLDLPALTERSRGLAGIGYSLGSLKGTCTAASRQSAVRCSGPGTWKKSRFLAYDADGKSSDAVT